MYKANTHTHPGRQVGGWADGQAGCCYCNMLNYEKLLSLKFPE